MAESAAIVPEGRGGGREGTSTTTSPLPSNEISPTTETRKGEKGTGAILLRSPRRYQNRTTKEDTGEGWQPPSLAWLEGTWSVTHSTVGMWRKAKNVRITYRVASGSGNRGEVLDDLVESVPVEKVFILLS